MRLARVLTERARTGRRLVLVADKYPSWAVAVFFSVLFVALLIWAHMSAGPILLARAASTKRTIVYGEFAQSSVAIIAVSLTVLAILYALPDRPAISDLRVGGAWPRLQRLLLSISALALITLVTAHIGTAVDDSAVGIEWLELLMLSASISAIVAALAAGVTFALTLHVSGLPPDPSAGRGELKRSR